MMEELGPLMMIANALFQLSPIVFLIVAAVFVILIGIDHFSRRRRD